MLKVDIYSNKGVKKATRAFPKKYQEKNNEDLLAQALRVYKARKHFHLARTKTRSEVALSTRKIYRQKGTGRARHGAKSAPIFVGGGVTHGPKGKGRVLTLPKKIKSKALKIALCKKVLNQEVVVVDGLSLLRKTKDAQILAKKLLSNFDQPKKMSFIFSQEEKEKLAFRNLKNTSLFSFSVLNAYDVFWGGLLVFEKKALFEEKEKDKRKENKV